MKKIFKRLVIFFIGLPILFSVVVFFPHYNHLVLNLVIIVFSVLGAVEFRNILVFKNMEISVPEAVIVGAIGPAAWTATVSFGLTGQIVSGAFVLASSWLLVSRIFSSTEKLKSYLNRTIAGFAVMVYPGFFMAWMVQMAVFPRAETVILVFLLIVFLNDAGAWLAGNLFGKNNRGLIAASPNKSCAGFIGGLVISILIGIIAAIIVPEVFISRVMASIPAAAFLGFCAGAAAILGDLGESALKRSADVKDSGTLILGRGGALDSIDSLALAAPVYYFLYQFLFK